MEKISGLVILYTVGDGERIGGFSVNYRDKNPVSGRRDGSSRNLIDQQSTSDARWTQREILTSSMRSTTLVKSDSTKPREVRAHVPSLHTINHYIFGCWKCSIGLQKYLQTKFQPHEEKYINTECLKIYRESVLHLLKYRSTYFYRVITPPH